MKRVALLSFVLMLSACGGGSGGGGSATYVEKQRPQNCEFKFTEGEGIDAEALAQEKTEVTNFGKEFFGNILDGVLKASAADTVEVIKKAGSPVYKAPGDGCPFFGSLPPAQGEVLAFWKEALSSIPASEDGKGPILAGLYPGQEVFQNGQLTGIHNIIVRDDSTRWTLVHEMMHFLFHKWEIEKGESNIKLAQRQRKLGRAADVAMQKYKQQSTAANFAAAMTAAAASFETDHEENKRSALEEATVENTLSLRFVKNALKFVPRGEALSNWYLQTNLEKGAETYSRPVKFVEYYGGVVAEKLKENDNSMSETRRKIAELVVDSEDKAVEKARLEGVLEGLRQDRDEWLSAQTTLNVWKERIVKIVQEMEDMAKAAAERQQSAGDLNPLALLSNLSLSAYSQLPQPVRIDSGCVYSREFVPQHGWLEGF